MVREDQKSQIESLARLILGERQEAEKKNKGVLAGFIDLLNTNHHGALSYIISSIMSDALRRERQHESIERMNEVDLAEEILMVIMADPEVARIGLTKK